MRSPSSHCAWKLDTVELSGPAWKGCYYTRCARVKMERTQWRQRALFGELMGKKGNEAEWYTEPIWPFISPGNTMGKLNTMQMRRSQFISVRPLSALGRGGCTMAMPALIRMPKVGRSGRHGAEWRTEGAEGQRRTDVRYKVRITCRSRKGIFALWLLFSKLILKQ